MQFTLFQASSSKTLTLFRVYFQLAVQHAAVAKRKLDSKENNFIGMAADKEITEKGCGTVS